MHLSAHSIKPPGGTGKGEDGGQQRRPDVPFGSARRRRRAAHARPGATCSPRRSKANWHASHSDVQAQAAGLPQKSAGARLRHSLLPGQSRSGTGPCSRSKDGLEVGRAVVSGVVVEGVSVPVPSGVPADSPPPPTPSSSPAGLSLMVSAVVLEPAGVEGSALSPSLASSVLLVRSGEEEAPSPPPLPPSLSRAPWLPWPSLPLFWLSSLVGSWLSLPLPPSALLALSPARALPPSGVPLSGVLLSEVLLSGVLLSGVPLSAGASLGSTHFLVLTSQTFLPVQSLSAQDARWEERQAAGSASTRGRASVALARRRPGRR